MDVLNILLLIMAANQPIRLAYDSKDDSFWWKYPVREIFLEAADKFVREVGGKVKIWAASRDWFMEEWGRDTFISLPGILLVPGKFKEAREVIENFAGHMRNGLIPNRIPEGKEAEYNTADAPMWFIQAVKSYFEYTKDTEFTVSMIPVLEEIIRAYKNGTGYERFGGMQAIKMDEKDCLIINPSQSTWMDADPSGKGLSVVTPRNGKCVEINALWYSNLRFTAALLRHAHNSPKAREYNLIADKVRISFNAEFWNTPERALFDVIEGDEHGGAIRPNMLFAVSHGGDLLSPVKQAAVFDCARKDLLTPGGLRTLSPRDSNYKGTYDTSLPMEQKDMAYHQGTAWPWLMGTYCDSLAKVKKIQGIDTSRIRLEIAQVVGPLVRFCIESPHRSLPEVFSGSEPYEPGGTRSQAWSIAEVLRVLDKFKITELKARTK